MDLNQMVLAHDRALTERGAVFSSERSIRKRPYPAGKEFSVADMLRLLTHLPFLVRTMKSLLTNLRLIRSDCTAETRIMSHTTFRGLQRLLRDLGVDSWGWTSLEPADVYKGKGIPYPNAIVITMNMDNEHFADAPSMDGQLEVMKIYGRTGVAVNEISRFLREHGLNATPNHSMGGAIDYAKAGVKANLGYMGRHGMLITPENGACHRSAVVYTDIANLDEFVNKAQDHTWISDYCASCGTCIRRCPTGAIRESPEVDTYGNVSAVDYERCSAGFAKYGCGVCIAVCPFTTVGYERVRNVYLREAARSATMPQRTLEGSARMSQDVSKQHFSGARDRIIDAAMELFGEKGFAATSTRKIAEAAGVSEGLIFHHFQTKMELLMEIFRSRDTLALQIRRTVETSSSAPVRSCLQRIASEYVRLLHAQGRIFNMLLGESRTNAVLYDTFRQRMGDSVALVAKLLDERKETGEIREDLDSESAVTSLYGSLLVFFLLNKHLDEPQWYEQAGSYVDSVLELWYGGAGGPASLSPR